MNRKKVHDKCCIYPTMECNPDACAHYKPCYAERIQNMLTVLGVVARYQYLGGDDGETINY